MIAAHQCLHHDGHAQEGGDLELLELCAVLADALSRPSDATGYRVRPAAWRQLRGIATLRTYELGGGLARLMSGVVDLRAALVDLEDSDHESRDYVLAEMAVALTRLGEQTSDLAPLHEALSLLDARLPFAPADYRLANARAVAMMRIGAMAADSTLVEIAARDLQAFVRTAGLTGAASEMCSRNIVAILLENARQERSERVYRDVIRILRPRVPATLTSISDRHYAQFMGSALLEVSKIELEGNPDRVENAQEAMTLLERLVGGNEGSARSRLEALHQLGQARFLLGYTTRTRDLVERALSALRDAIALCEPERHLRDGRRPRLLSDLANYTLAYGRLFNTIDAKAEAEQLFVSAIDEVPVERAPGLHVQIAHGLFDLLYREERWDDAVLVAEDIDRALALVEGDPRLSAGVRLQGARLRAAVTAKHATCLIARNRVRDASIILERARGRRIAVAMNDATSAPLGMSEFGAVEIAAAEEALRDALSGEDDTACRLAWEYLARARRKAGLDLGSREDAMAALSEAAVEGGVFLQLHFSEHGSHMICWHSGASNPSLFDLPSKAFAAIGALFRGETGWIPTYERALGDAADHASTADRIATWNSAIGHCQQVLGETIFTTAEQALESLGVGAGADVYICPPGDLALLPIAAARLGDGGYAAERWSIGIVPNARVLMGKTRPIESSLCIGGWTDGSDGHPALPMAMLETATLASSIPGMTVLPVVHATPSRMVAAMATASIVHVACHAVYDAEVPGRSGLELPGARLSLSRLAAAALQQVPTRLVYLSCCEAGMTGRTRDFDEFVGLPGGFLQVGVQGVIASLWAVDDVAAMVFARTFYDHWRPTVSVMSPAEALGRAQCWMRTVNWQELEASGYLPCEVIDRMQQGQMRSSPRRVEEAGFSNDHIAYATRTPFQEPIHWAGWTLFGR